VQKIIHSILDFLLIMGALVGILTIDGGKWLITNPAFYQPGSQEWLYNSPVPIEYNTAVDPAPVVKPPAAALCSETPTPVPSGVDEPAIPEDKPGQPTPLAVACK